MSNFGNSDLIEQAFSLARGGDVQSIRDLRRRLSRAGFTYAQLDQITGTSLARELREIIAAVNGAKRVRS